jgi:hypothetical protein
MLKYLKISNNHFLPNPFHLAIQVEKSSLIIQRLSNATEKSCEGGVIRITVSTCPDFHLGYTQYTRGINPTVLMNLRGCIQTFPDWPPGARTANGTILCH